MANGAGNVKRLQIGQSSTVGTVAGTFYDVDWQGELDPGTAQEFLPVDLQRDDGESAIPQLGNKEASLGPVSYTHLTLPTILLV